jgi:hypothetical protein
LANWIIELASSETVKLTDTAGFSVGFDASFFVGFASLKPSIDFAVVCDGFFQTPELWLLCEATNF